MVMEAEIGAERLAHHPSPRPIKIEPDDMGDPDRPESPTLDKVSSAAAAMLKLSSSAPTALPAVGYAPKYEYDSSSASVSTSPTHSFNGDSAHLNTMLSAAGKLVRKQREFTPDARKDNHYWMKRAKNNEAAKRSREKRRVNDIVMAQQVRELQDANSALQQELAAIKKRFGIPVDQCFVDPSVPHSEHQVTASTSQPATATSQPSHVPISQHWPSSESSQDAILASAKATTPHMPALIPVAVLNRSLGLDFNSPPQGANALPSSLHLPTSHLPYPRAPDQPSTHAERAFPCGPGVPVENGGHNEAASFHSTLKAPEICRPISPDSIDSSPGSLTISFSAASSGAESDGESPRKWRNTGYYKPPPQSTSPPSTAHASPPIYVPVNMVRADRSRERKGIPHKLRHKEQFMNWELPPSDTDVQGHVMPAIPTNGFIASAEAMAQAYPEEPATQGNRCHTDGEESQSSVDSYSQNPPLGGGKIKDKKYSERRQKNNLAARKCRENRRTLNELRLAKSEFLESENSKLKQELRSLSDEVHNLKDWLEKKNEAKAKGEPFEPPMLEPSMPHLVIDTPPMEEDAQAPKPNQPDAM